MGPKPPRGAGAKKSKPSKADKPRRPTPITRSALAEKKSVTRGAVTKACYPGGPLADALLPNERIDLGHPATQAWLAGGKITEGAPRALSDEEILEKYGDLTLNEIVERFGSVPGFADHVDVRKKIAETHKIELANAETEGELISRDLVKTHVFGAIDGVNRRLLSDTVKTITSRLFALSKAGGSIEEGQRVARELMSATLAPMKRGAERTLRERG